MLFSLLDDGGRNQDDIGRLIRPDASGLRYRPESLMGAAMQSRIDEDRHSQKKEGSNKIEISHTFNDVYNAFS